jgi:GNAT superfamily N-acetyltransferase
MTTARLTDLAETPELVPLLAEWHQRQFGYLARSLPVEGRMARLQTHVEGRPLPKTFVAWRSDEPVGCASLVVNDMSILPTWTPWLAGVYVLPAHRSHGIGKQLVHRVTAEAAAQRFARCYLYTQDRVTFYTALGWQPLFTRLYRGYEMTIMAVDLPAAG